MAATASSLPWAVHTETLCQLFIHPILVAFCKAKITWFAVNTEHSTNCWDNARLEMPQMCVIDHSAWAPDRKQGYDSPTWEFTQCPFPASVLSTIFGLIISKKEALPPSLIIVEDFWKLRASLGSATPFCFLHSGSIWALIHGLVLSMFLFKRLSSFSGTTDCPNATSSYRNEVWGLRQEKGEGEQLKALQAIQWNTIKFLLSSPSLCLFSSFVRLRHNRASRSCERGRFILSDFVLYLLWRRQKSSGNGKCVWKHQHKEVSEIQK